MNYFIIAETDWTISGTEFSRLLRERWPDVQLEEERNPEHSELLHFLLSMRHSRVRGSLNRAGNAIVFVGDLRDCAEVALWCRTLAPPAEQLLLCDEGMNGSLHLTNETTKEEIYKAFEVSLP